MENSQTITRCRISGSINLVPVVNLGNQALTGVFPKSREEEVPLAPLSLVWAPESGLVQLEHSFTPDQMYGDNYGYRSGLNPMMVRHLTRKVEWLERCYPLAEGDLVIDVGSNDGTLLNAYSRKDAVRIGFDPVASKFLNFYEDSIKVVTDFFSPKSVKQEALGGASIITSVAMFYDLEDPNEFVGLVESLLDLDGVWHFEQSYLPAMLRSNSYDTICHEHLEYYSLRVVKNLLESNGMKILDVQTNSVNGGSFAVTAGRIDSNLSPNTAVISWLLRQEDALKLDTFEPYLRFSHRVMRHRTELTDLVTSLRKDGQTIGAYGASTKGNVLLQFCGLTSEEIDFVAEVNPEKFGAFTPGTLIPIVSESEAKLMNPDYLLVLPWHFRDFIIEKESEFLRNGGKLIFPLPEIDIVC